MDQPTQIQPELLRHDAEGEKERAEDIDRPEHRLTPRDRSSLRATLHVEDRRDRQHGREDEGEEEGLVQEWELRRSPPVVCDQHCGCPSS